MPCRCASSADIAFSPCRYDYGVDESYFWISMKFYKTSLRVWRSKQTRPLSENLALYMGIYSKVLSAMQFLRDSKINHYDIKCDNFLLEPAREVRSGFSLL
jgi:serine/threonine protein kinase